MADSREARFQQDIIDQMVSEGWLTGPASGYDRAAALYPEDLLAYFKDAWPERWEKFCKNTPQKSEEAFLKAVVRELDMAAWKCCVMGSRCQGSRSTSAASNLTMV